MDTKKQSLEKIKSKWSSIEYKINNTGWSKYADDLLNLCKDETKKHLGFKPVGIKHGLTLTEESKFFAVQRISEYLYGTDKPDLKTYLHTNQSVFMAYAIAKEFKIILKKIITKEEANYFVKLDYCKFANGEVV